MDNENHHHSPAEHPSTKVHVTYKMPTIIVDVENSTKV
jgi:hypothetical protein